MMPGRHDGDGDRAPNYNIAFTKRGNGHGGSSHSHLVGSELSVSDNALSEFTVLVAGCRGGKTSFLRLLLDTSNVSPNVPPDDIVSVAKFVQGCSSHTTHIRTASIDVDIDLDGPGSYQRLGLNLIDTPALDYQDERAAERVVSDIMHLVEARFVDTMEDPRKIHGAGGFVHLCLYFLDPDQIAPPRIPASAAPTLARVRGNSFSQSAQELDPSSPHNPLFNRPTLPLGDVNAIRRLSTKCNVLPVIAKADTLSNDRLAAVKIAVRRDLAEGGIGFGIFDDPVHRSQAEVLLKNGDYRNGSSSAVNSPPTSPVSPAPRLPYALISPDAYSHSDGVLRSTPSRQQLINQYTPLYSSPPSKLVPGVYTRSFRWGVLDVLDPGHCDFLPLRNAIFHHMNTLQTYTRDYLFTRFQQEYTERLPPRPSLSSVHLPGPPPGALSTRPVLAIDTAGPHSSISRNQSVPVSREMSAGRDLHSVSIGRPLSDISVSASTKGLPKAKQRAKKIPVACNFCRSRKLKCDGGRPACSQCVKRQNACDYMAQSKRRGGLRTQSDSDSGEDDQNETTPISEAPSHSHSYHHPRRASNAGRMTPMPINLSAGEASTSSSHSRSLFRDNELPHIATLALPERAPPTPLPMSAPPLPPLRSPEQPTRKRALTAPGGKNGRHPSTSGPKVVACNFCRARKTKCDGAHPACSSCVRRSLACNYVNDRDNNNGGDSGGKKSGKRTSTSARPSPPTPPSSQMASAGEDRDDDRYLDEYEMKRGVEHADMRPSKRMRMDR